jgi:P-type Mg2+ transporter
MKTETNHAAYWGQSLEDLYHRLDTGPKGLSAAEAQRRLNQFGLNTLRKKQQTSALVLFLRQFKDPLILILIFAVGVSVVVGEWVDAGVVAAVIIGSTILSFVQEYRATKAVEQLMARVTIRTTVLRDGQPTSIVTEQVVPGDVVSLSGGNLIPGDGVIIEAKSCYVDQAALTGETFPVEKAPGTVNEEATLSERTNCVFMGTSVRTGTATAIIVQTGTKTAFGQIAERLTLRPPETEFERGIRHFGYLLARIVLIFVLFVFAINVLANKPTVDSLLFAIALAVGMAPELLPAVITITLSRGAQQMATKGVIVRRLNSIENFGNMDILCTDKTGTLTQGTIQLNNVFDVAGKPSDEVALDAFLNAHFQVGVRNPLDEAILASSKQWESKAGEYQKLDEVPYDFNRRCLSIVVQHGDEPPLVITKGALESVLAISSQAQIEDKLVTLDDGQRNQIHQRFNEWSGQGLRVLGVATKPVDKKDSYGPSDEKDLVFRGFLLFFDPPKEDVRQTLADLAAIGVQLKIISGDNPQVTQYVANQVGLPIAGVMTGGQLHRMSDQALWHQAEKTTLFVEVDPNQKERIIRTLQKMGHVVGYMGDGINDAPALHVADVGISVDSAVDVAKEAADFVLLEHSLSTLREGILNGRKTFANTLKYVFTTTSANFGNMFSMAGLSVFLPFLPMLASQILLNNFLSDLPGMSIASDNVDPGMIEKPRRWDIHFIRDFMIIFGLVSSVFDYLTFGLLLFVVHAGPEEFRTGWFIESLLTELVIALVVRTRFPFFRSRPGKWLLISTVIVAVLTLVLPYLPPVDALFEFVPLPLPIMLALLGITALYVVATEIAKKLFYEHWHFG